MVVSICEGAGVVAGIGLIDVAGVDGVGVGVGSEFVVGVVGVVEVGVLNLARRLLLISSAERSCGGSTAVGSCCGGSTFIGCGG